MLIEVGPVSAASARAWIAYARRVVQTRRAHDRETLPEDIRAGFLAYLDAWERAARRPGLLRWQTDIDPAVAEYLVHGFYRVATRLAEEAERRGTPQAPPEGEAFYRSLVHGLLDAMSTHGGSVAQFADELRTFWPGLAEDDDGLAEPTGG